MMEIDRDYLAQIFDGEQLYVLQSEREAVDYDVEKNSSEPAKAEEPQNKIKANVADAQLPRKEVVILLNEGVGSSEKETLNKLLKAINIDEGQYEIIHEHPGQLKSIQHLKLFLSFHSQYVQSTDYSILNINKGKAIYAHDLAELNRDSSKKLMLWNLLKTIV